MKILKIICVTNLFAFLLSVSINWGYNRTVNFPYSIDLGHIFQYGIPFLSLTLVALMSFKKAPKTWLLISSIPLISFIIRIVST